MSSSSDEDLKFFLANQLQSFAVPLLSILLDQKNGSNDLGLSGECRNQLVQVSSAALRNEQWALRMFDSHGRLQSGVASGSLHNLMGNYDQCISGATTPTSFCLAHINLGTRQLVPFDEYNFATDGDSYGADSLVRFGFCAPSSCNANNITVVARHLLNSSHLLRPLSLDHIDCHHQQDDSGWLQTSSLVSISLLSAAIVCSMVATMLPPNRRPTTNTKWLLDAFSLGRNANKLMQKRKQSVPTMGPNQTIIIDGLRVVSTIWIIIIHSYNFAFQWLWFDNLFKVRHVYQSFWLQWIANGTFSIDNFFLISGFLAHLKRSSMESGLKRKRTPSDDATDAAEGKQAVGALMLESLIGRYLRLAPMMLVVILLSVALFPNLNSLSFNMATTRLMFSDWCEKNWPLNGILLQNWIRTPNQCFGHTWFVAVDFQLLLAVQFAFYLVSRIVPPSSSFRPGRSTILVLVVGLLAGQLISAMVVYLNQLQSMPVIPAESVDKLNEYFRLVYIKPYYWFSSYAMGMLLAMFVLDRKAASRAKSGSRSTKMGPAGVILARILHYSISLVPVTILVLILLSLYPYFLHQPRMSPLHSAFYVLLVRPLWSASVAFLLYLMIVQPNRDFVIKTMRGCLSFRLWLPLSRLSYVAYLIHPAIMAIFYGSATGSMRYSSPLFVYFAAGNIVLTFAAAYVLHLLLESPLQTILLAVSNKQWTSQLFAPRSLVSLSSVAPYNE